MIMRHSARGAGSRPLTWAWVVPVLLLICALTIPRLDLEAFYIDEGASLFNVGALHTGPVSLTKVLEETAEHSPEQALGWPVLLYAWGRLVGWSEPAVRTLPLLVGLLTIALVYRTGTDLFTPGVGLSAALLLGGSSLLLVYVTVARAFTLVPLFATLSIWSYWRSALRPRAPGPGALAGFFLGALGQCYSHYFGALLIPALGLYHLLFVKLSRRWWRPTLLMALAVLLGLLQLPVFLQGVNRTLNNEMLRTNAQGTAELFAQVLHNLGNGLINPGLTVSAVLLLAVTLAVLLAACWRWRVKGQWNALWLLIFTAVVYLWLALLVNARFQVMPSNRIRYLISMWPLAALAGAALLRRPARLLAPPVLALLLALWLVQGVQLSRARDYRVGMDYLQPSEIHHVYRVLDRTIHAGDLLVIDHEAMQLDPARNYDRWLSRPYRILNRNLDDPLADILPIHERSPWVWLLYRTGDRASVQKHTAGMERVLCEVVYDERGFILERHALPGLACPDAPIRLAFQEGFTLAEPDIALVDDRLRVDLLLRSEDAQAPVHYSIALHLIDVATLERSAQLDLGIGAGNIVPLHAEFDLGELAAGEYALRFSLYNWETDARLTGRDLSLGHVSDIHTLQHIFIE